jgi:hypothetical protein
MKISHVGRKRLGIISLSVLGIALLAFAATPAAHADAIYNFTFDGCSGGCGPTPFGTIDLHAVNPDTVQITVSLLNGNKFVTTGKHIGFAFNVQGGPVTLGTLPTGWANAAPHLTQAAFGTFSDGIDCTKGNSNAKSGCNGDDPWVGTLQFDVSRGSGLDLSDFVADSKGFFFSADMMSGTTGNTGPVGAKGPATFTPVPEPGTLATMGTGVLSLAFGLRKRLCNR